MSPSEKKIFEHIGFQGFEVQTFSKKEKKDKKTPDFKLLKDGKLVGYCEVKEINEDQRDFYGGIEKDNTYNIISDCINESYKQFVSVNCDHRVPNILAIYSKRMAIDILDMKITYEGGYWTSQGEFLPWLKNISEGRIKERKKHIDMCIWYDEFSNDYKYMINSKSKFRKVLILSFK